MKITTLTQSSLLALAISLTLAQVSAPTHAQHTPATPAPATRASLESATQLAQAIPAATDPNKKPETDAEKAAAEKTQRVEPIVVSGFRREYRTREGGAALGMSVDTLSLPLGVSVIPKDLLADQAITNVEDALRNVSGVTRFKEGNGGEEKFSIRGFDASRNIFIDGARLNNGFNATNISSTETANIDRFEVLKGPSAILFGSGLPGGVINYTSKRPTFKPYAAIDAYIGSFDYKRVEVDATQPVNETLAWRGVFSHEDSEGFRDFDSRRRTLVNPTLALRAGPITAYAGYSYIRDRYTQERGQTLQRAEDGSYFYSTFLKPDMFLGIPGFNERTNSTYQRANLNVEYKPSDNFRVELIAAGTKVEKQFFDASGDLVQDDGTVEIGAGFQSGNARTSYLRANVEASFGDPSNVEHRLLFSASRDGNRNNPQFADLFGTGTAIFDTRTRRYDTTGFSDQVNPETLDTSFFTKTIEQTYSIQNLMTIRDRHIVLLGLGYTRYREVLDNYAVSKANPRFGYIYKVSPAVSVYGNYATGFFPSAAFDKDSNYLKPETMRQAEIGFKADLLNSRLLLTGSAFSIEQRNQAVTDPASLALPPDQQYSIALGRTRTRGVELQAVGKLTNQWRLIAGYAALDAKLIDDGPDFNNDGNRLGGIPRHSANLWSVYDFEGAWKGLGVGAGVFAQSGVPIGFENRSFYGGWAQLDLVAYYKRGGWKAQLNVKNVTDRQYLLTQALTFERIAAIRVGTSTPRTIVFSISKEF
jgi:iron complex outermembrane recepter protein